MRDELLPAYKINLFLVHFTDSNFSYHLIHLSEFENLNVNKTVLPPICLRVE